MVQNPLSAIYQVFDNNNCKALFNRPKLFVIEACRGSQRLKPKQDLRHPQRLPVIDENTDENKNEKESRKINSSLIQHMYNYTNQESYLRQIYATMDNLILWLLNQVNHQVGY